MIKNVVALVLVLGLAVPANAGWKFWKKEPPQKPIIITSTNYIACVIVGAVGLGIGIGLHKAFHSCPDPIPTPVPVVPLDANSTDTAEQQRAGLDEINSDALQDAAESNQDTAWKRDLHRIADILERREKRLMAAEIFKFIGKPNTIMDGILLLPLSLLWSYYTFNKKNNQ
ncbi:MAG: hypothetical protein LBL71_02625 [Endomicrobium sp.]|jgi:hypothetical protein|nr:hypothetical protein [Endomicrobium sp.]